MLAYPLHTVSGNSVKRSHKLNKTSSTLSKFVLFLNSFTITLLAARHFKQIFVWRKRKVHIKLSVNQMCIHIEWWHWYFGKVWTLFWLHTNSPVYVSYSESLCYIYVNIAIILPQSFATNLHQQQKVHHPTIFSAQLNLKRPTIYGMDSKFVSNWNIAHIPDRTLPHMQLEMGQFWS